MDSVFDGYVGDHPLKSAFTWMANLGESIAKVLKNLIVEVYKCCTYSDLLGFLHLETTCNDLVFL